MWSNCFSKGLSLPSTLMPAQKLTFLVFSVELPKPPYVRFIALCGSATVLDNFAFREVLGMIASAPSSDSVRRLEASWNCCCASPWSRCDLWPANDYPGPGCSESFRLP